MTAVSLACLGLYGTLSYFVSVRRREVGVRLALGALRQQIASRFLFEGLRIAAIGCVYGLGDFGDIEQAAFGMLYGVSNLDAVTFGGVMVLVLAVASFAS